MQLSRGPNVIACSGLFIAEQALTNPFRLRFRFRGLPSAHDLLTLGFRHANPNVRGFDFCLWFFGSTFHPCQCSQ